MLFRKKKMTPDLSSIREAIASNPYCTPAIFTSYGVYYQEYGSTSGPEILALIHAHGDQKFGGYGYWYGFICNHYNKHNIFSSHIVRIKNFITGINIEDAFSYFLTEVLEYKGYDIPILIQNRIYSESKSIVDAINELSSMIHKFNPKETDICSIEENYMHYIIDMRIYHSFSSRRHITYPFEYVMRTK